MLQKLIRPKLWTSILGLAAVLTIISFVFDYSAVWQAPVTVLAWTQGQVIGVLNDSYDMPGWIPVLLFAAGLSSGMIIVSKSNNATATESVPVDGTDARSAPIFKIEDPDRRELVRLAEDRDTSKSRNQSIVLLHDAIEDALDAGVSSRDIDLILRTIERSRDHSANSVRQP